MSNIDINECLKFEY